jgi:hypothetical protein
MIFDYFIVKKAQYQPASNTFCIEVEFEHTCWYPKDGELYLGKTKPEETLVEVCSDSDVQIDRQT